MVIGIIGIFATIAWSVLSEARLRTEYTNAQKEIQQLGLAIIFAQVETGNVLLSITGSGCSACQCAAGEDLRNIDTGSSCYQQWETALNNIVTTGEGLADGLEEATRDPWGSPYLLDENEGEQPSNFCRLDTLRTAGEDGIRNTADDYVLTLPFTSAQCN